MAFFECGGVRLMLAMPEGSGDDHHTSVIYYQVDDIWAMTKVIGERGVELKSKPQLGARLPDHEPVVGVLPQP